MIRYKSEQLHQQQLAHLQKQMVSRTQTISLAPSKNPSNTLRNSDFKKKSESLSIDHFNQILSLDLEKMILTVEPKMTVRTLTRLLLRHKVMLPVVPEFSSITVGGAILGSSLESSSHRFGQFNDLCLSYEVLLADGSCITLSPHENSDLFYALPGSYGTLALLTMVTIKVVKAKPFVHLKATRYWDTPPLIAALGRPHSHDFVEGILFSKSWGITIMGNLQDERQDLPLNKQKRPYKKWYYHHLLDKTKEGSYEELMPLEDYLFRLDRSAFWMGRYVSKFSLLLSIIFSYKLSDLAAKVKKKAKYLKLEQGPSLLFRFFFAPVLTSKNLYKIWHKVPNKITENLFFIHDFYTPLSKVETMLTKCIDHTQIFPIWLCPIKNCTQGQFLSPHYCEERMMNIGLYGIPKGEVPIPLLTEKLEKELYLHGGKKMLYSYTYYDKALFAKIYDQKSYNTLREKYGATHAFLSLYNKVTNTTIVP